MKCPNFFLFFVGGEGGFCRCLVVVVSIRFKFQFHEKKEYFSEIFFVRSRIIIIINSSTNGDGDNIFIDEGSGFVKSLF